MEINVKIELEAGAAAMTAVMALVELAQLGRLKTVTLPDPETGDSAAAPASSPPVIVPNPAPGPVAPAAAPAAATVVPTAARTFTLDELGRAGAKLIESGKASLETLQAAVKKFGVQTLNDMPASNYDAFAAELRALGADL